MCRYLDTIRSTSSNELRAVDFPLIYYLYISDRYFSNIGAYRSMIFPSMSMNKDCNWAKWQLLCSKISILLNTVHTYSREIEQRTQPNGDIDDIRDFPSFPTA